MRDQNPRVLIVDDDFVYRYAASKTIRATGLAGKIEECSNGIEALNYLKENICNSENLPDIIFLDINMPAMDGWEFLSEFNAMVSRISKTILIYIVSSSLDKSDLSRSKEINMVTDFLVKPVFKETFSKILQGVQL
jgi:two-component system chemotaxis response regulator CheY